LTTGTETVRLLHLCDSLFPTGAFAHSDGLETATTAGTVATPADLDEWMRAVVEQTLLRAEGPAVLCAWNAESAGDERSLLSLDAEMWALRPSSAARQATRAIGGRLLKSWNALYPTASLSALIADHVPTRLATLPVAFGAVCASAGITAAQALTGFFYTRIAATASSAMRLMPIGQRDAHHLVSAHLARCPALVAAIIDESPQPSSFSPALDIAAMGQQYVRSRLFLS
jgi:urease accessory protein